MGRQGQTLAAPCPRSSQVALTEPANALIRDNRGWQGSRCLIRTDALTALSGRGTYSITANAGSLPLSCFSIGVAPVALGFSGGLIVNDARNSIILKLLAGIDLGSCCSIGCRLMDHCLGLNTLLLFALCFDALCTPFVPGYGCRQTLLLSC